MKWQESSLSEISEFIGRGKSPLYEDESDFPILNQACIQHGALDLSKFKFVSEDHFVGLDATRRTQPGDILVNSTGTGTLGRIGFWDRNSTVAIDSHVTLVRLKQNYEPRFFYYWLNMPEAQTQIQNDCISGSTNQVELSREAFRKIRVRFPPARTEQTAIADVLTTVDRAIEQTEALIAKQRRIKAGLMHDLLTRGIDEQGNLRHPSTHEFKESPLGLVPEEWEVEPIREIIDFITDYRGMTPPYSDHGIPVISAENIGGGQIKRIKKYVTHAIYVHWTTRGLPEEGDIIITTEAPVGEVASLPGDQTYLLTRRVIGLRPRPDRMYKRFLYWLLFRYHAMSYWEKYLRGSTVPRVLKPDILNRLIARPSVAEQMSISEILDNQNSFIDSNRDQVAKLKVIKTGLMQDLLTGRVSVEPLLANRERLLSRDGAPAANGGE